jgi:hypothetical protein
MKTRQELVDAYKAAAIAEHELWKQMKGLAPGQPGFDRQLWDRWMRAVSVTNAAAKALREGSGIGTIGSLDRRGTSGGCQRPRASAAVGQLPIM